MKCTDIIIRDPFILVYEGKYYLYGTRSETAFADEASGFDVYISIDLENWDGPFEVFQRPENFWSSRCYWAPEVYRYRDQFYMFATFAGEGRHLGTCVLRADSPCGPFAMLSDGFVTPADRRCLDGTLYISPDEKPYMVFCMHGMEETYDGAVCAMELTADLRQAAGEPAELFRASSAKPFVRKYRGTHYVTDGPFLIRTDDQKLHMLWSTYGETGYVQALAHSDNHEIDGIWNSDETLLFDRDGGHGMIFRKPDGGYCLSLHYPNTFGSEHPCFIPLEYSGGFTLVKGTAGE